MSLLVIGRESRKLIGERNPRPKMQTRRAKLKELQICINGPLPGAKYGRPTVKHGPVVLGKNGQPGVRCKRCKDIHKYGYAEAIRRAVAS